MNSTSLCISKKVTPRLIQPRACSASGRYIPTTLRWKFLLTIDQRPKAVSLRRDTGRRQAATWDQRGDFVVWARQSVGTPTTQRHHIHIGKRGTTRSHCFIACRFPSGKGRQLGSVLLPAVLLVVIGTDLTSTSVTTSIRFPFTIIDRYRDWFPAATAAGIRRGDVGSTGDRSC